MKKRIKELKKIRNLSFYHNSKNEWNNWSFFLYDPFFHYWISYFLRTGDKKKVFKLMLKILMILKKITRLSPIYVMKKALINCQVFLEIIPVLKKKRKTKEVRVLFYKSKMYDSKRKIQKGIELLVAHSKLIAKKKKLSLDRSIACAILNSFFKQGPVYLKVQKLYECIGNYNRKRRFYRNKNKILHTKVKKKKVRKLRNIKKRIHSKKRHDKSYSIYGLAYKLGK